MNKLHVLKPDLHTGYLNYGKGQEITYLAVPENVSMNELDEDIAAGATQFKELREFATKKPSKVVIVNCNNKEEGLKAVSYLSSIYNRMDKLDPEEAYDEDEVYDEMDMSFEDFDEDDVLGLNDEDDDLDDEEWEAGNQWEENPWKIPVLSSVDLANDSQYGFNPFYKGGIGFGAVSNPKNRLPYWYYTRKENICIVHNIIGSGLFPAVPASTLINSLKRYKNNRHVFIVVVSEKEASDPFEANDLDSDQQALCEVILEYTAGTFNITNNEEDMKKYYVDLFENWVDRFGYSLKKGFKSDKITEAIIAIDNKDKSALIEKVLKYVAKEERDGLELTEDDFNILSKFKLIGAKLENKELKSVRKLEDELVGMDDVKEQIKGIVSVMRYNKRRKSMGLGTSNFHNVHMMLGAPGTAKTTVAELLGNMMAEEKLLPSNRFVSVNGAELKGMYVGHSAPKVKALFDNYDIILIDEAYAVAAGRDGDTDSFSQEAIAQLIIELEKHGMDKLVIFAGYGGVNVSEKDNKMKSFLNANPGIRSRINSTIYFDSYTPEEMEKIFMCHAKLGKFNVDKKAGKLIREFFAERVDNRDFGNGREARSLLENTLIETAKRMADIPEEELTEKMMQEITLEDIKKAIDKIKLGYNMQSGKGVGKCGFAF